MFTLLFLLFSLGICAPWTQSNSDYNVNFNPEKTPSSYYGKYDGHEYFNSPSDLRSYSVYQFVTDRFANGKPTNDEGKYGGVDLTSVGARHGGDFVGIMDKLDYIKSLGFNAIWISPIFQNLENSYHGYAQTDFTILDDRFGTLEEFRNMVDEAHQRGIRVIVDIVVNHMSNLFYFEGYEQGSAPFHLHTDEYRLFYRDENQQYADFQINNTFYDSGTYCDVYGQDGEAHSDTSGQGSYWCSDFHHNGDLSDYSDPYCNDLGKIYGIMDDLRTTHPRVQDKIIAMTKSLITSTDIDGIRMDTPMQVPLEFFKNWVPAIKEHAKSLGKKNFLAFAEFFCSKQFAADMTNRGKTPSMYKNPNAFIDDRLAFNGGINYPFYFWTQNTIKQQQGNVNGLLTNYYEDWDMFDFYNPYSDDTRYLQCNFFNNHDQWRMASNTDDGFQKQDLATFVILFFPGIPLFYYGDEQGLLTLGTALDGFSREDMMTSLAWDNLTVSGQPNKAIGDNFDMASAHFQWVKKLNQIRNAYNVFSCDEIIERYTQTGNNNGIEMWSKSCTTTDTQWLLFGMNTWKEQLSTMSSFKVFNEEATIVNIFNPSEEYTLDSSGNLQGLSFDGYETKIFCKKEELQVLPPIITSCSPSHDQSFTNGETEVTFKITFDQSMNTDLLEQSNAFSSSSNMKIVNVNCVETSCSIDCSILEEGIHILTLNEGQTKSSYGIQMIGTFSTRIRTGRTQNILANRKATADYSGDLVKKIAGTNQLEITHKAIGAEQFRVYFEQDDQWTDWMNVHTQDMVNLPTSAQSQKIKIQYFADHSTAYIVESKF